MMIFDVKNSTVKIKSIETPEGINLSLPEVLKASEYTVLATCEEMALFRTCIAEIELGVNKLNAPNDDELNMIDTLPIVTPLTRLLVKSILTKISMVQLLTYKHNNLYA